MEIAGHKLYTQGCEFLDPIIETALASSIDKNNFSQKNNISEYI